MIFSLRACMRFILLAVLFSTFAQAHVVRVEVISRADVDNGKPFGAAGAYEKIMGRVYFAVGTDNPHNRQIVDLNKAARNSQGEVEFSSDFYLFRPKDMSKGNDAVLFEVSNRGGRGILRLVNGANGSSESGDGFLFRQGFTVAWVGWQYDLPDQNQNVRLTAPIAHEPGTAIHGLVRSDFTPSVARNDMPLGHILLGPAGGQSYAVDDRSSVLNVLTVRDTPNGKRQTIPRSQWSFAHAEGGKLGG